MGVILINQKKSGEDLGRFYRVDFTRYPSNHFSGCRLNGRIITVFLGIATFFQFKPETAFRLGKQRKPVRDNLMFI
jgi:hypothetical protein